MTQYNKFYLWCLSVCVIATGVFWAYYLGFIEKIYQADSTHLTSAIAVLFVIRTLMIGWYAFLDQNKSSYYHQTVDNHRKKHNSAAWFASEQIMALGMLGTVIGLIGMLSISVGTDLSNPDSLQTLITGLYRSMGLALYTNAVGLTASIILKYQIKYISE